MMQRGRVVTRWIPIEAAIRVIAVLFYDDLFVACMVVYILCCDSVPYTIFRMMDGNLAEDLFQAFHEWTD